MSPRLKALLIYPLKQLPKRYNYYPHFTHEDTETQRGQGVAELEFTFRAVWPQIQAVNHQSNSDFPPKKDSLPMSRLGHFYHHAGLPPLALMGDCRTAPGPCFRQEVRRLLSRYGSPLGPEMSLRQGPLGYKSHIDPQALKNGNETSGSPSSAFCSH